MKQFAVKKQYLLLIAGSVWMLAGFMVMKTGFTFLLKSTSLGLILLGASIIFLIFYLKIFSKLVRKHEIRIGIALFSCGIKFIVRYIKFNAE